jgi:1-acyl-sn-glycerol-3-phosphate acyltransferase
VGEDIEKIRPQYNEPMAFFWSLVFVDPLIIFSTIVFGSASVAVSLFDKSGRSMIAIARVWARSLLKIVRVRVRVEGLDRIDPRGAYVFVANHLSYMDTPVVLSHIPVQFRFMAKRGLFQIPFLGTHLIQAGHIPVPREDPRAALKTLTQAAKAIQDRGVSLLVFPEGGRSVDGVLQDFKEGAAYIAIKAGVPMVPVTLIGTREILAMGSATFRSGQVTLRIGDPIPTTGLTLRDRGRVTEALRERIAGSIYELSKST